jgi:hypothetical protein
VARVERQRRIVVRRVGAAVVVGHREELRRALVWRFRNSPTPLASAERISESPATRANLQFLVRFTDLKFAQRKAKPQANFKSSAPTTQRLAADSVAF